MKILRGEWQAGTLVRRYKRFLADVRLKASNELVTAHCPNTGAMTGCLESGADVWLSHSDDPSRKTSFTLELTRIDGHYIGLNTHNANRLIEEAIIKGRLGPELHDLHPDREVTVEGGRLDFRLGSQDEDHFVEVKSVTWMEGKGVGRFPDAKSDRAVKHLAHLAHLVKQGASGTLVFCVQHSGIKSVEPARVIDPRYAEALAQVVSEGVVCKAFKTQFRPPHAFVTKALPVHIR